MFGCWPVRRARVRASSWWRGMFGVRTLHSLGGGFRIQDICAVSDYKYGDEMRCTCPSFVSSQRSFSVFVSSSPDRHDLTTTESAAHSCFGFVAGCHAHAHSSFVIRHTSIRPYVTRHRHIFDKIKAMEFLWLKLPYRSSANLK